MGTPAFPNLGKHCSVGDCRQIDFLPFTCDCCRLVRCFVTAYAFVSLAINFVAGAGMIWVLSLEAGIFQWGLLVFVNCVEIEAVEFMFFVLSTGATVDIDVPKPTKMMLLLSSAPSVQRASAYFLRKDPNITWESHVNTECDPSNYEKATKKKKCPVPRCREMLTFSNTIKCRDCSIDHCLKHRFGPDHNCPGPKKPEASFQFMGFRSKSVKDQPKQAASTSSSNWTSGFLKLASSFRATAEAGISRLSSEFNQEPSTNRTMQSSRGSTSNRGSASGQVEACPHCKLRFSTVGALVDHVEKVHEQNGVMKVTLDICPKCSKGFRDPVALVEHVEKDHGGASKA
ncbi:UNVERIFIED_CONTAM: Zinc finger AN1 and C2H2 domain-containing stress-associated protein 13 [Sesamum calycinum]|uniref:Zinc finger AN1 and C2H2 domain-containing stress-associated protein 13 n=1 Tax=Sesamum calycinum TaxID=2727403 RepID=A0AAW2RTM7_9LAMI